MHLTIPLWIIAIGVVWMASKPWREQRRRLRDYRRGMELLYGQPQPQPAAAAPPKRTPPQGIPLFQISLVLAVLAFVAGGFVSH
jgi:hypothetical protein